MRKGGPGCLLAHVCLLMCGNVVMCGIVLMCGNVLMRGGAPPPADAGVCIFFNEEL